MPDLNTEQLAALARAGAKDREIEAALGRPMTEADRAAVDRARVLERLRRKVSPRPGPQDKASLMLAHKKRDALIPYKDPADAKRRKKLEKNPEKWLRHYLHQRFPLPFGEPHREIVKATMRAMIAGTSITVAAPRGYGKTSLLWGLALYGVLTGLARFPVVVGWKQTAGAELLDQWLEALATNDRLAEDYPCTCDPFRKSTAGKRLQNLLRSVNPDERCGTDVRKSRGIVILPATLEPNGRTLPQAALAGASMNGSIKGLNVGLLNGESLRPDIAMLDDPQDTATAESEVLVKKIVKRIDYGLRSLSGPRRRLAVMSAVTCVADGDVSEHLLTRPGTEAIRFGQIISWPDGWDKEKGTTRKLWDEWNGVRLDGLENLDGGKAARDFYKQNRDALTKGMAVSWEHRFHAGDANRPSDPDAMFAAMWDFYDLGESAFMAERQNVPLKEGVTVYTLNEAVITSRTTDRDPGVVPADVAQIVAGVDVNPSYGLTWGVCGYSLQLAHVLDYGKTATAITKDMPEQEQARRVYEALVTQFRALAARPYRVNLILFDLRGWNYESAYNLSAMATRLSGINTIGAMGYGARMYRSNFKSAGRRGNNWHTVIDTKQRQYLSYNADFWKEVSQKAWLGSIGAPGSCSLPRGHHREFAEQICREPLLSRTDTSMGVRWEYGNLPGPHDMGDVMQMCYLGADTLGIGTGGMVMPRRRYVETRRAKVGVEG